MVTLVFLLSVISQVNEESDLRKPDAFVFAENERARIKTARINWCGSIESAARIEDSYRYYTDCYAGADQLLINRGFADGRMWRSARAGDPFAFSEDRLLMKEGEQWLYMEGGTSARVASARSNFTSYLQLRDLGFEPSPIASNLEAWFRVPTTSYSLDEVLSDRVVVTGHFDNGYRLRWTLDPARGMQPIEVAAVSGAEDVDVCRTEYEETDGIWFPRESVFTHRGKVIMRIVVLTAEFNRPDHPPTISPQDIGLLPGMSVQHDVFGDNYWDGVQLVPMRQWLEEKRWEHIDGTAMLALMEEAESPTGLSRFPKAMNDDFLGLTSTVTRKPGLWEDYTRRFIQRFRLQGEQIDRAWAHLKECQKPAYAYLDEQKGVIREAETERAKVAAEWAKVAADWAKVEAELEKVETDRVKPGASPAPSAGTKDATPAGDSTQERSAAKALDPASADAADGVGGKPRAALQEQRDKLDERLKQLYEPIEKIFEEKLKPGLAKIPTQAQIDAARARESDAARVRESEAARDRESEAARDRESEASRMPATKP